MKDYPEIMKTREAARYLCVSPSTLEHMRLQSRGPKFFRIGKQVRYRACDLVAFIEINMMGELK